MGWDRLLDGFDDDLCGSDLCFFEFSGCDLFLFYFGWLMRADFPMQVDRMGNSVSGFFKGKYSASCCG